jgi:hypothetical protein
VKKLTNKKGRKEEDERKEKNRKEKNLKGINEMMWLRETRVYCALAAGALVCVHFG